ncbi:MAG: hypothetical protein ACREBW_07540, partial [Candidatus Micrarchaeaceae archaeon]
ALDMRKCLFCSNISTSHEHYFPKWIFRLTTSTPPYLLTLGGLRAMPVHRGSAKTKQVCGDCNSGWMSALEAAASKLIGSLSQDIAMWLNVEDQSIIARWSVKTSMVLEALDRKAYAKHGHAQGQREAIRLGASLPANTQIWLGRYTRTGLGAFGDRFDLNVPKIPVVCNGRIASFIIGHMLIQVVSLNVPREYEGVNITLKTRTGPWGQSLIQIWPSRTKLYWPPALSFSVDGPLAASNLIRRLDIQP